MTTTGPYLRPRRLPLLGWTLVLLLLSTPASLPLFALTVAGLPVIAAFGAGIPLVAIAVWLTRRLTDTHRWIFATALGVRIPRPYRPAGSGSVLRRLLAPLREAATWRDLAWLLLNSVMGVTLYTFLLGLFGGFLWYGNLPLLWRILEQSGGRDVASNVLHTDFGIWEIDSQASAFYGFPIALLSLLLWWLLTPPLLRGYAKLSGTLLRPTGSASLAARVRQLTESRAETIDTQAAELRRIERDLHDGTQARLVALGMNLGMAEELLRTDPEAAAALLTEARQDSGEALAELRALVRGIHPPVLADRGLSGAVQALALAHPLPVEVTDRLPGRLPAPVESAAYFAVAEALTNVAKHARASTASVLLGYDSGRLVVTVTDDGRGGAVAVIGGGLAGMQRRMAAFDGTVSITSPPGGPTLLTLEIPCDPVTRDAHRADPA